MDEEPQSPWGDQRDQPGDAGDDGFVLFGRWVRISLSAYDRIGITGTPAGMRGSANRRAIHGAIGYRTHYRTQRRAGLLVGAGPGDRAWLKLLPVLLAIVGLGWLVWLVGVDRGVERAASLDSAPAGPADPDGFVWVPFALEHGARPPLAAATATPKSAAAPGQRIEASAGEPCLRRREQAEQALSRGEWAQLEQLARRKSCWPRASTAVGLRMQALFELERYHECIDLGATSPAKETARWANNCRRALLLQ
ncbi:MAG TPA: hypothetical protein VK034_10670 [Enhygromyxa sp.]|nr:hypothetical protein [Enhygromyxa sp.]